MKKKFIAVSVLLCALALSSTTLTSCVDDNESASVTAIRDAKAKQLTALANYTDVKAQNETIIAAAEAALKNAEAKAQEIKNSLKDLELQKAQAALADEIEAEKAKAEAELLKQQAALEAAKAALIKAMDQTDAATQWKINSLMDYANAIMYGGYYVSYVNEFGNATTDYMDPTQSIAGTGGLQSQLITKKGELIAAKYNLEDGKITLANLLTEKSNDLATNEALLAEYEKYNNSSREDAEKAYKEAVQAKTAIDATVEEARKAYWAELDKVSAAITNINATEVGKFIHYGSPTNSDGTWNPDYVYENWLLIDKYTEEDDTYKNVDPIKFTYDDGTAGVINPSYSEHKRLLKANELTQDIEAADLNIKAAQKNLEDAKKYKEEALKETNTTYKALKDAVTAAQKNFDENPQDITIPGGTGDLLQQAKDALKNYEENAESWVTSAEEELARKEAEKKELTDFQTLMTGDLYKTYETVYAEYVKAEDASQTAQIAQNKAVHNQTVQYQLVSDLYNYCYNQTIDWEVMINQTKQSINSNKEDIEKLEAGIYANGSTDSEAALQDAIKIVEDQIATLETRIAQKQSQYDSTIKQVEALINGETVPETPSEGGNEETPAE